jgi:hypothetical protein
VEHLPKSTVKFFCNHHIFDSLFLICVKLFEELIMALIYLTGPVISDDFVNPNKRLYMAKFSGVWKHEVSDTNPLLNERKDHLG